MFQVLSWPGNPSRHRSIKRCIESASAEDLPKALACFPNLFQLSTNTYGATVWHLAAERNDVTLLRCLHALFREQHTGSKDQSARPFSTPDKQGKTALHIACARGDTESVKLLLSWGALPHEERDKKGRLPIHLAARHGGDKIVLLLLQAADARMPASGSSRSADDTAAAELQTATEQEQQAIEYARTMACATDAYGLTPLHYATAANDAASCTLLLDAGAPLLATSTAACHKNSMPCDAGMTALHVAAMKNALRAAEVLLMAWANMPVLERIAQWAPSPAAWSGGGGGGGGSRAALADLRAVCDREGKTAYMVAVKRRVKPLVKMLDPSTPLPLPDQEPPVKPPALLCCPITMELMQDPAVVSDGFTYERAAIDKWLAVHRTSPMTNLPLEQTAVFPNHALRQAVSDWRVEHGMSELPCLASAGTSPGASHKERPGALWRRR